jgi:hypothetical protein
MRRLVLVLGLAGAVSAIRVRAEDVRGRDYLGDAEAERHEACVSIIDADTSPATTPGPGAITGGIVALDCNQRSLFVDMLEPQEVTQIILRSDPSSHPPGTGNVNLSPDRLELYSSADNRTFTKVQFRHAAPDKDTVIMDQFRIRARYLKVHSTCDARTDYRFVNQLRRLSPTFVTPGLTGAAYYELPDPLFGELLGETPAADRTLYWSGNCDDEIGRLRPWYRANAKRFGYRYVFAEQLEETAAHRLVYGGKQTDWLKAAGIDTWRFIIGDPGEAFVPSIGGMPMVFETQGWLLDPRWQAEYLRRAFTRAKAQEQWALSAGDETWEIMAIRAVPKAKRYQEVDQADSVIRAQYGFGKYGMPDGNGDADPFRRIAHRRWASDQLTELYRQTWQAVKAANPDTVMMAPDFASGVPAADIEAWAPYFDIFQGQCSSGPSHFVALFCVGCDTKVLVDLSGKPCWMSVQNATPPNYGYTVTPELVREMYSQVFRNGGHGLFLLASEWFERELNHPKYAEPAKWRALLAVVDRVRGMNLPRLPAADTAILFSSDSMLTLEWAQLNNGDWELYSAYTALGPILRSWFQIVSDRQLERGSRKLADYKVVYIPFAEYERSSVLERIEEYVNNGGTIICSDAEAFTWNLNGETLTPRWEGLTGVRRLERLPAAQPFRTVLPNPLPITAEISVTTLSPGWRVAPVSDDVRAVAVYEDGSPAVTLHPYGKGKVVYFAADPFVIPGGWGASRSLVAPGAPVMALVEAIQRDAGCRMGLDIWRFKLPAFTGDMYQKEQGVCLTNNYVYDRNEPLRAANNVDTTGAYRYSRLPAAGGEVSQAGAWVPFAEGRLTNRYAAYASRATGMPWKVDQIEEATLRWAVRWADSQPFSITFDLARDYPLRKVRLFYSGILPALQARGSHDGKAWTDLATCPQEAAGQDVRDAMLPLAGAYRYVDLGFAAWPAGERCELCEVEIWGDAAP